MNVAHVFRQLTELKLCVTVEGLALNHTLICDGEMREEENEKENILYNRLRVHASFGCDHVGLGLCESSAREHNTKCRIYVWVSAVSMLE